MSSDDSLNAWKKRELDEYCRNSQEEHLTRSWALTEDVFNHYLNLKDDDTSNNPPYHVPKAEAMLYYYGIPSMLELVYRSSWNTRPWIKPKWHVQMKRLWSVGEHKLGDFTGFSKEMFNVLDSRGIKWKSMEPITIITEDEEDGTRVHDPVTLWVAITPGTTISSEVAHDAANGLLDVLKKNGITDAEVEFRQNNYG